jgi:hypothetical protein
VEEIILVHVRYEQQIDQWHKIINLQLYQIKYTKSYDVLNLVYRFSNKKLNKTGLIFLWFFYDFIQILKDLWFKRKD